MATTTILQALSSISNYPVPASVYESVAVRRGLNLSATYSPSVDAGKAYQLATADVYMYLATAPNVSQGGQSYSIDADTRSLFKKKAAAIAKEQGETSLIGGVYGYKGTRL